jgi:hypothetical protein
VSTSAQLRKNLSTATAAESREKQIYQAAQKARHDYLKSHGYLSSSGSNSNKNITKPNAKITEQEKQHQKIAQWRLSNHKKFQENF